MQRTSMGKPAWWLPSLVGLGLSMAGCASYDKAIESSQRFPEQINWPDEYRPQEARFFIHNEIAINASPQKVWEVLIAAETWPDWYEGASDVSVVGGGGVLEPGSVFTWKTMGMRFTSTVTEFVPNSRLSWESKKRVIRGLHAWLIIPTDSGCVLLTDESQHGSLAGLEKAFQPNKLRQLHDTWLREIKAKAEAAEQRS